MSILEAAVREHLDSHLVGVLATEAADGRPRQSVVYYARDGEQLLISTLSERLKARDVRRSGWASLCVVGREGPYPAAVFSGPAEILTRDIGAATAAIVQRITNAAQPPEVQGDEALASVGRVILRIAIERVSAVNHIAGAAH
jgi:PPOX class probable F420-dependent enzyme